MNGQSPKVSILMGIYNCATMLEGCVQSILNQTYENWELIMCDDGSADNTLLVAQYLVNKHPGKMILIKNETNKGLAYSLNRCLEVSSGPFLARQDSDDFSRPERLEKQVNFLLNNSEYGWVGTATEVFDETEIRGARILKEQPIKLDLASGSQFCHATAMFRSEVLKAVKYKVAWYTRRGQDYDLWMRLYAKGFVGYNMPDVLYRVREDKHTYSRRKYRDRLKEVVMRFNGYKDMKLPIWLYIYMFKPVMAGLVPKEIMKQRQERRLSVERTSVKNTN
ncbi:glycosyltransferase family 2 protein [Mesobacillus harenae]|uniref:glycosyltransferase family 2 protein n=1 Tax=Mesobacillus harenae TaxID=2213203 RepID=UPI00157FC1DA|nr:glycosyltransferase [Mesobacillus harenae]